MQSVGYRVKAPEVHSSGNGRRVLKDYLLKGYSVNQRLNDMGKELAEIKVTLYEHSKKIDFFVRT